MPENRKQLEDLRQMASLMRRLSGEHAAADHPLIAAKLAQVAAVLDTRAVTLERLPSCSVDYVRQRHEADDADADRARTPRHGSSLA